MKLRHYHCAHSSHGAASRRCRLLRLPLVVVSASWLLCGRVACAACVACRLCRCLCRGRRNSSGARCRPNAQLPSESAPPNKYTNSSAALCLVVCAVFVILLLIIRLSSAVAQREAPDWRKLKPAGQCADRQVKCAAGGGRRAAGAGDEQMPLGPRRRVERPKRACRLSRISSPTHLLSLALAAGSPASPPGSISRMLCCKQSWLRLNYATKQQRKLFAANWPHGRSCPSGHCSLG